MSNQDQFTDFIKNNKRVFAKTYAKTAPHEYIMKYGLPLEDQKTMIEFANFIRENGYKEIFFDKPFMYFNIGEYKYRSMDEDLNDTDIINRAKL